MTASHPAWHSFAILQTAVDPLSIDRSLARDEALDAVLADVEADPAYNEDAFKKRFYSLCRNRRSKQISRRKLEARRFRPTHRRAGAADGAVMLTPPVPSVVDQIAYEQLTALILAVLPREDFQILLEIADGHSYADMARARNTTLSALKARAFRVRERVRNSPIAPVLRSGGRRAASNSGEVAHGHA